MVANCNVPISVNDENKRRRQRRVVEGCRTCRSAGDQLKLSLQLPLADPVQVASCACARFGASIASEPSQTLPSSAARVTAGRAADIANSPAWPRIRSGGRTPVRCRPASSRTHPTQTHHRRLSNTQLPYQQMGRAIPMNRRAHAYPTVHGMTGCTPDQFASWRLGANYSRCSFCVTRGNGYPRLATRSRANSLGRALTRTDPNGKTHSR